MTTPGVYVEETPGPARRIAGVATSTAAFVGAAHRGPMWTPDGPRATLAPLAGFDDFARLYGGLDDLPWGPNHLAHAVRAFFDNGGTRLFVSRLDHPAGHGAPPAAPAYAAALRALEPIDEVSIVAAPDAAAHVGVTPAVHAALVAHVERAGAHRTAVLDTPAGLTPAGALAVRGRLDSTRAALYHPWVVVAHPAAGGAPAEIALPPSGFVCGIYARTAAQRGVWRAPANEVVVGALRLEPAVSRAQQEVLGPAGVNCLRTFPGRGTRVWGARTTSHDPDFRYVQVRRYLDYLEHSLARGTRWVAFEANGEPLWAAVRDAVARFLHDEWRAGALVGTRAADAWFVRCDRSTMTQHDVDGGRLVCLVGVALVKPAEFVIFRVAQRTADARG